LSSKILEENIIEDVHLNVFKYQHADKIIEGNKTYVTASVAGFEEVIKFDGIFGTLQLDTVKDAREHVHAHDCDKE
jgi:hypothetical protein